MLDKVLMKRRSTPIPRILLAAFLTSLFSMPLAALSTSAQELDEMDVGDPADIPPLTQPMLPSGS